MIKLQIHNLNNYWYCKWGKNINIGEKAMAKIKIRSNPYEKKVCQKEEKDENNKLIWALNIFDK